MHTGLTEILRQEIPGFGILRDRVSTLQAVAAFNSPRQPREKPQRREARHEQIRAGLHRDEARQRARALSNGRSGMVMWLAG